MSRPGKRPIRSLNPQEKLEAIQRVHKGESKASVARDIGVPESTLRGWCKNEDKISYLSQQSSPEADESTSGMEPKEKRIKLEETLQPYNLSKKSNGVGTISPNSDFTKTDFDDVKPLNLNVKTENYKMNSAAVAERNKAELARLTVDLKLNQPETFLPNNNTTNLDMALMAQWQALLLQQKAFKSASADASSHASCSAQNFSQSRLENGHKHKSHKSSKMTDKQSVVDDPLWSWFKTRSMLEIMQNQNGLLSGTPVVNTTNPSNFSIMRYIATTRANNNNLPSTTYVTSTPSSTTSNVTSAYSTTTPNASTSVPDVTSTSNIYSDVHNNFKFWQWYKNGEDLYGLQHSQPLQEKPILYQQLTKSKENGNNENILNENEAIEQNKTPKEGRNLLDDLLRINNNNNVTTGQNDVKEDILSLNEALMHGEKFVKYLECCQAPTVTQMQIHQLKYLLNNIRNGLDRKNGEMQHKSKVKRK